MRFVFAIIAAVFAAAVFAAEPHYWMKQYPGADQAKVQRCLAVAEEVRDKQLKGGMDGVAWATLHQGNAWEKCMDGK